MKWLEMDPKSHVLEWPLMTSIWPVAALTAAYVLFVTSVGPAMVRGSKPMSLTRVMQAYNAAQVIFSTWWIVKFFSNWEAVGYFWRSTFSPETFVVNPKIEHQIDELVYYYLLSKYVELLDTVFFVLRQKWNQVTFLHVYHHANMAVTTWFYLKYLWGRNIVMLSSVNVVIHVLMYSYYLLSSLGPAVRPYLWWKRYLTRLQLAQFVMVMAYAGLIWTNGSPAQPIFICFTLLNTTSFLLLFVNFYIRAYCRSPSTPLPSPCRPKIH